MRRNLFLYLALACFIAITGIFIVDGYMGIYDTIYVTAGEYEQKIAPDWYRYRYPASTGAVWGAPVHFRYEIDNRRFSTYSTPIRASLWKENEKVIDLFAEDKSIKPFDKVTVEWILDSEQLQALGFSAGQYTVKIERKGAEWNIIVGYHIEYPVKPPVIR